MVQQQNIEVKDIKNLELETLHAISLRQKEYSQPINSSGI
jgi:hypothetical protein